MVPLYPSITLELAAWLVLVDYWLSNIFEDFFLCTSLIENVGELKFHIFLSSSMPIPLHCWWCRIWCAWVTWSPVSCSGFLVDTRDRLQSYDMSHPYLADGFRRKNTSNYDFIWNYFLSNLTIIFELNALSLLSNSSQGTLSYII